MRYRMVILLLLSLLVAACGKNEPKKPSETDAYIACKNSVRQRLKAPSTADFSSFGSTSISTLRVGRRAGKDEVQYLVRGYVDAQNSFGAQLRNSYSCTITVATGGNYRVDELSIK